MKSLRRLALVAITAAITFAPNVALGYLTAALEWNNYRIPVFCTALALVLNLRRIVRRIRGMRFSLVRRPQPNGSSYRGIPVPELASFLLDSRAFKRDEAIKRLGLSQGQYLKIAEELEAKGVLTRGEANARVLRDIGREHLVQQLRDGFPLVFDPERNIWVERDGAFARWTLDKEFKQRKLEDQTERAERKLDRVRERVAEESQALVPSSVMAHVSAF